MSWEVINQILALATVDHHFCQELLDCPLEAIRARGFPLTAREQEIMRYVVANSLDEFGQHMLETLSPANTGSNGVETNHI